MSYRDFEGRLELVKKKVNASELVELAFERKIGKIKKKKTLLNYDLAFLSVQLKKGLRNFLMKEKSEKKAMVKTPSMLKTISFVLGESRTNYARQYHLRKYTKLHW